MNQSTYETYANITTADIEVAAERLRQYKAGKQRLDSRLYDEKMWWRNRLGGSGSTTTHQASSAWLFNSVSHKHADMCDNYPTCRVLPKEPGDEQDAAMLSDILPVILKNCHFDQIYSDNAWSKLKHGMAAYGVFWNPERENGLGDIDIRRVDVMNLFWAPDVANLQESPHVFLVSLEDTQGLAARYHIAPQDLENISRDGAVAETGGSYLTHTQGYDDKTAVVDWYYKTITPHGREVVHFAKFTGCTLLYASENDPLYAECGWYDHGQYPFVLDVLYPEEGTPEGYGLLSIGRNPQGYIDELDNHILTYANWASRVRYWAKRSLGISEKDFLDLDKQLIMVEGDIDDEKLRQITLAPMDGALSEIRQMKIEELKETTGVRDVSLGGTSGGVTSAAAIVALQEAGSKTSRACVTGTYRAYVEILCQVIELIRQFYDGKRTFRIMGKGEGHSEQDYHYVSYSNMGLCERAVGFGSNGEARYYRPVFDIDVSAEKQSPQDRLSRNELMLRLYQEGMLAPGEETAALRALSGMDFEGIGGLRFALKETTIP